jgi:hypothetical protein
MNELRMSKNRLAVGAIALLGLGIVLYCIVYSIMLLHSGGPLFPMPDGCSRWCWPSRPRHKLCSGEMEYEGLALR